MPHQGQRDFNPVAEPTSWLDVDDMVVRRLLVRLQSANRALDELREALETPDGSQTSCQAPCADTVSEDA